MQNESALTLMNEYATCLSHKSTANCSRGFTLVEMAMVLAIIGLAMGFLLPLTSGLRDGQKRQAVATTLATVDAALVNFVAQNKRLPCPADGTIPSGPTAGVETLVVATGVCNSANQINGVVPWVALGISESSASDPWGNRISYRVYPPLAMANPAIAPIALGSGLMDMTACDPAGGLAAPALTGAACLTFTTGCTQCAVSTAISNYLVDKGLPVTADGVNWLNQPSAKTGAAYVLVSHGPSTAGSYSNAGVLQPGTVALGTHELLNQNNLALMTGSVAAQSYRDAQLNEATTAAHFDDYLSHPSVMAMLQKANLGPRAH